MATTINNITRVEFASRNIDTIRSRYDVCKDGLIMCISFPTSKDVCEFHVEVKSSKLILACVVLPAPVSLASALKTLVVM
jgi:hypothetical protein